MMKPNWADTRHHPPGSDKAISQRKAVSEGYDVAQCKSPVKIFIPQRSAKDCAKVPGISRGCK